MAASLFSQATGQRPALWGGKSSSDALRAKTGVKAGAAGEGDGFRRGRTRMCWNWRRIGFHGNRHWRASNSRLPSFDADTEQGRLVGNHLLPEHRLRYP